MIAGLQHQRIGVGLEPVGQGDRMGRRPAAVIEIVVVKMDGAVLLRRVAKAMLFARPV